nr:retrovirus-related Pol polyprotein from transposon TNT 1-94 [Tanacetum cinerariifolium]
TEKKKLGKNEEAKMTIYNALPHKEYEQVFMCKTAKKVWHTLIITHQGNSQVMNCKIDLITQEYNKFSISNEETLDSSFTRFNVIVTSLKSLDPDYSSKNYPKTWPLSLSLDELIDNLKVYEMVLDNDGIAFKTTKEKVKSLALKSKVTWEQTIEDSDSQGESDEDTDEEEAKAFNLLENKAFIEGAWSDSEDGDGQLNEETRLMAIDSQEVTHQKIGTTSLQFIFACGCVLNAIYYRAIGLWIVVMTENKRLFTSYKAYNGGHVVFRSNLKGKVTGGGNITHDSIIITNVEHVSGLAFNLIRVGQLYDDDCVVSFSKVKCDISKNGKLLAKGHRRNGLYTCKLGDSFKQQICRAPVMDNSMFWHRRLGHANMRLVQNIASNELVRNLTKLSFERHFCDTCGLESQGNANNRTRKEVSTNKVLELLHLNLVGPSVIQSYGGNFYTLMIVDDYSNYTWVVFI